MLRHRNPLWDSRIGVTPRRCLTVVWLHTLSLGVLLDWCAFVIHELLSRNAWGIVGPSARVWEEGVSRLAAELYAWYDTEKRAGRDHTRLQHLSASMLGSNTERKLSIHAAECNGVLCFFAAAASAPWCCIARPLELSSGHTVSA